ncbi:putative chloroperoxidase [Septoria linicola]|nr:putative chloroperoxidase [Septoria linicola]
MLFTLKHGFVLAALSLQATAFPFALEANEKIGLPTPSPLEALSKARGNCGNIPCLTFDEKDQFVSTTGEHAYASPLPGQIRGPCPGLNAAANHGYLPRSGVATILQTVDGLGQSFGMGPVLSAFLAAYGVLMTGDPVLGTWSIGGAQPTNVLTKALLGQAQGISNSHNTYETDMSIGRKDAYINNGDAHSLDIKQFTQAYEWGVKDGSDRYTLDKFAQDFRNKGAQSIATNPYFFSAPFSGVLVAPAAYMFVINLMSNHSAEEPNGWLDGEMFKTFFAVEGQYPNFKWLPGQERIPERWYRRPSTQMYDAANVNSDVAVQYTAYPDSFKLGGNANGVNSYAGVKLEDLTGGVMAMDSLFDPANPKAVCFMAQFTQALIPDAAGGLLGALSPVTKAVNGLISSSIKPLAAGFDCPIVSRFDQSLFNKFPGQKYSPTSKSTTY